MLGISPRSSTGQSRVRCCPGGRRCSSGRDILPVRNFPSCAQRCLLRVSLLSGGGSFWSVMSEPLFDAFSSREPVPTPHRVRGRLSLEPACPLVPMHRRFLLGVTLRPIDD